VGLKFDRVRASICYGVNESMGHAEAAIVTLRDLSDDKAGLWGHHDIVHSCDNFKFRFV
jgi:hypothetical protein